MSVRALLSSLAAAEEADTSRLLAAALNFDRLATKLTTGKDSYTPDDIQRIGRVVSEYANASAAASVVSADAFRPAGRVTDRNAADLAATEPQRASSI